MARRRPVATALLGTLAVGLLGGLAGCGGPDDEPGGLSPSPSPTSTSPTSASASGDPSEGASADPSAYLPVPEGRELTAPGTALKFGDTALAAWKPRQDLVGVVGLSVDDVRKTTVERSLSGFQLDARAKASTPYFVSMLVGNGGDTDLGGRQLPVYAVDSAGRLVPPTGVDQGFEPCPGSLLPAVFAPGDKARSCLIFLVPSGAELESVTFRPPEGVVPITWSGRVRALGGGTPRSTRPTDGPTDGPTR